MQPLSSPYVLSVLALAVAFPHVVSDVLESTSSRCGVYPLSLESADFVLVPQLRA